MRQSQSDQEPSEEAPPLHLSESKLYVEAQRVPRFAWESRWLRGHEYALLLRRADDYASRLGICRYPLNQHPLQIYQRPANGMLYFMQGSSLERFGFPRIDRKKKYCWKKMNFITNLPKRQPQVKYIVASSYLAASLSTERPEEFRMHVARLAGEGEGMLCHIRQISGEERGLPWLPECFEGPAPDFYRLFMHLHNHHHFPK